MSTFSWGNVKINIFSYTSNFLAWFLLFSWGVLALKNVDVYSLLEGRGSQKVYGLYNHENVDIYGWPLNFLHKNALKKRKLPLLSKRVIALNLYIDINELVYERKLMMKVFSMTKFLC